MPLLTSPGFVDPLRTTDAGFGLFDTYSATPFVDVVVVDDDETGTGNFDAKFCFEEPPTEDSERVTGWFDANDVSCKSVKINLQVWFKIKFKCHQFFNKWADGMKVANYTKHEVTF